MSSTLNIKRCTYLWIQRNSKKFDIFKVRKWTFSIAYTLLLIVFTVSQFKYRQVKFPFSNYLDIIYICKQIFINQLEDLMISQRQHLYWNAFVITHIYNYVFCCIFSSHGTHQFTCSRLYNYAAQNRLGPPWRSKWNPEGILYLFR